MIKQKINLIGLAGPPGSGKSSILKVLQNRYKIIALYDLAFESPFLKSYHKKSIPMSELQIQMWLFINRITLLHNAIEGTDTGAIFYDFDLELSDKVFTENFRNKEHLYLYRDFRKVYNTFLEKFSHSKTIVLTAEIDVLLKRLEKRNKTADKYIKKQTVEDIISSFKNNKNQAYMWINTSNISINDVVKLIETDSFIKDLLI